LKYLFLSLILFLSSCSLSKDSVYWNEDLTEEANKKNELSVILKKKQLLNSLKEKYGDFKTMTFDEFNVFLKDYSNKAEYPDINKWKI